MAKFCHEMHHVLPMSLIFVIFSPLTLSLRNRKYDSFYFETDDVIIIIIIKMLEIILISTRRGCSILVGS
jgi:hypothetical protein